MAVECRVSTHFLRDVDTLSPLPSPSPPRGARPSIKTPFSRVRSFFIILSLDRQTSLTLFSSLSRCRPPSLPPSPPLYHRWTGSSTRPRRNAFSAMKLASHGRGRRERGRQKERTRFFPILSSFLPLRQHSHRARTKSSQFILPNTLTETDMTGGRAG